jgi:hypothetical protein
MSIETVTRSESTATCDGPKFDARCITAPIKSPTDRYALAKALPAAGWVVRAEGDFCSSCHQALEAAGKLGPRT